VNHRQVDDTFDSGLSRKVERDERLRKLVGNDGVKKEQCRHARERRVHRVDIEKISLRDSDTGGECGFLGIPDECPHLSAALGELSKNVAATIAPYSVERERLLEHCCEEGFGKAALRRIAGMVRGTYAQAFCGQRPGTWRTHFSGRTHFHGTQAPPPTSESSASKFFRHPGMTLAFKNHV
jgi:hypothetical protein